jgi:glycosyltransferase involved in cell wall biosynthesis
MTYHATDMDGPLVSIVLPFYNPGPFLREAVDSVLCQTYSRWELALIDDGSDDGSTEWAKQLADEHPGRVLYVEHPGHANRGCAASRNVGLRSTAGELLALLDADDVWPADKLATQVALLGEHPGVGWVYGPALYWYSWTGEASDATRDYVQPLASRPCVVTDGSELLPRLLREQHPVPCPATVMVRRSLAVEVGGFEERVGIFDDQSFYTKVGLRSPSLNSGAISLKYRQHTKSLCAVSYGLGGTYRAEHRAYLEWLLGYLATRDAPALAEAAREVWRRQHGPAARIRAGMLGLVPTRVRRAIASLRDSVVGTGRAGPAPGGHA